MSTLMNAMVIEAFGESEQFTLLQVSKPTLKSNHALIKVKYSSVNPLDIKIRQGVVSPVPAFPLILNAEVVGVVEAVDDPSGYLQEGDLVFGVAGGIGANQGALAEFMLADCRLLAKVPEGLSGEDCAGLALVGLTATLALEKCTIKQGSSVLVHGGAGGVGHLAVQLAAKAHQANVSATVGSEEDAETVKSLGASHAINFRTEKVDAYVKRVTDNQGFDIIIDTVGQNNLINSLAAVAEYGHVVTTAARLELDISPLHAKSADLHVVFMMLPIINGPKDNKYQSILSNLAQKLFSKEITLLCHEKVYAFSAIANAQDDFTQGKTTGKIKLVNDLQG